MGEYKREGKSERERARELFGAVCLWRHPQVLYAPLSSNQAKMRPLSFSQATIGLDMGQHSVTQHLGLVSTPGKRTLTLSVAPPDPTQP